MSFKELTRAIQQDTVLLEKQGYEDLHNILKELKSKGLLGRFRIEHVIITDKEHIYATHMFNNFNFVGCLFPYGYYRNNN